MESELPQAPHHERASIGRVVDRSLAGICKAGGLLALPLSFLLFLQWPLRDIVGVYSREANDLAQILFALYVAIAISAATRARTHLAADSLARAYPSRLRRRMFRIASCVVLIPWAAFVLITAWPTVVQSVMQLERFPETFNPGYFVLRLAVALLALLVLIQAGLDGVGREPARDP